MISRLKYTTLLGAALSLLSAPAFADMQAAKVFLDNTIKRSVLTRAEQEAEMQWFVDASKPFAGMEIKIASEGIATHIYESEVLAEAF
ncbi:MAG: carbohydrate ABC transporter substrate-binding protein, partial [Amylibacter sp.]